MATIPYDARLKITNLEHLPRGTGAPYLEALRTNLVLGETVYIAIAWRRKPKRLARGRVLIQFA